MKIRNFLYYVNQNKFAHKLSITKWCCGLADKTSN